MKNAEKEAGKNAPTDFNCHMSVPDVSHWVKSRETIPSWKAYLCFICVYPLNLMFLSLILVAILFWYSLTTRILLLIYAVFIYFDRSGSHGGYKIFWEKGWVERLRSQFFWIASKDYYPISISMCKPNEKQLKKSKTTINLENNTNHNTPYLFACHPHGILGVAVMGIFGTNMFDLRKGFPDMGNLHLLGLKPIFSIPLFREICLTHGHGTPGRKTIENILQKNESLALAVGGAREALHAFPGTMRLVLKDRKGFIKIAIKKKAHLVPVLTFGENELYNRMDDKCGPTFRKVQAKLQKILGFSIPIFTGKYNLPFFPKSIPLHTVFGQPISLNDKTTDDLDMVHKQYINAIKDIFNKHKDLYLPPNTKLEII